MSPGPSWRRFLLPLNPIYRLALGARETRLRRGWEPVRQLRFPVISVGNLSTGGAGKTPLTIALARALRDRGFVVDVLSRGYGGRSKSAARVDPEGSPNDFGDEPLLIAREAGVPVYVAPERYYAGLMAEGSREHRSGGKAHDQSAPVSGTTEVVTFQDGITPEAHAPRVHILDDGFQHRQLHRDVDILLLNGEDWHDRLLPAGNLRETREAVRRAHVIAIPDDAAGLERELRSWGWDGPLWRLNRRMEVPRVDGPVVAFCGIARPRQFFTGLEAEGLRLGAAVAFPDHHRYSRRDVERLLNTARSSGVAALISTAKDQVRLAAVGPPFPSALPVLCARLQIEIQDEPASLDWLIRRVREAARESSL